MKIIKTEVMDDPFEEIDKPKFVINSKPKKEKRDDESDEEDREDREYSWKINRK